MWKATPSPYLVSFDGSFRVKRSPTGPPRDAPSRQSAERKLAKRVDQLDDLQQALYAHDRIAVLCIFQALDAAGKDGTIRAVWSGVDPIALEVHSFKQPSAEELDRDFLWRTSLHLPPRGRIGIFNRSYYEEVLVVRVHPEFLGPQKLPWRPTGPRLWEERLESIRQHEHHLARNGTVVLKFWLNVSRAEQRRRFLARLDTPRKNWKFSEQDVRESEHFDDYMKAYEAALNATSREWAPWYVIPADDKPFARLCVADIVVDTLRSLDLRYPEQEVEVAARFDELRKLLEPGEKRSKRPAKKK